MQLERVQHLSRDIFRNSFRECKIRISREFFALREFFPERLCSPFGSSSGLQVRLFEDGAPDICGAMPEILAAKPLKLTCLTLRVCITVNWKTICLTLLVLTRRGAVPVKTGTW